MDTKLQQRNKQIERSKIVVRKDRVTFKTPNMKERDEEQLDSDAKVYKKQLTSTTAS